MARMSLEEVQAELFPFVLLAVLHKPSSLRLGLVYHCLAAGCLARYLIGKVRPVASSKRRSRPIEVASIKHSHLFLELLGDILSRSIQ